MGLPADAREEYAALKQRVRELKLEHRNAVALKEVSRKVTSLDVAGCGLLIWLLLCNPRRSQPKGEPDRWSRLCNVYKSSVMYLKDVSQNGSPAARLCITTMSSVLGQLSALAPERQQARVVLPILIVLSGDSEGARPTEVAG